MPFSLPDDGEGANTIQSIFFQEYMEALVAGISRTDCVLSGCAVTAQGTPNMTVAVASGTVLSNSAQFTVTGANATIAAADATNPRLDLIVITSAGAIVVRAGTAAAAPKPANRTANDVLLAVVFIAAADTAIGATEIADLRVVPALAATQAEQEAAASTAVFVTPSQQQSHPSAAKAWGYVTLSGGTPTLQSSFNVTSITDDGVGKTIITIATDFSNTNYVVVITAEATSTAAYIAQNWTVYKAAGSFRSVVFSSFTALADVSFMFAAYGDH